MRDDAVLIDAGPLIAILDRSDIHHAACRRSLATIRGRCVTVWPALTEASYFLGRISSSGPDQLLRLMTSGALKLARLDEDDAHRMRELMAQYADLPMDLADAALVRAAEREGISTIFTTDRRDFTIYRPKHTRSFNVIP